MKVCVYCSQAVLADGLGVALREIQADVACTVFDTLAAFSETLHAGDSNPDLVVLGIEPSLTLEQLSDICAGAGSAPILFWVKSSSAEFLSQALQFGPRGVLSCGASKAQHLECLRAVIAGDLWICQEFNSRLAASSRIRLTARQRDLMGLLAQGLRNKEIAYSLGISTGTVKIYLSRLFRITKTSDRLELALLALRNLASDPQIAFRPPAAPNAAPPPVFPLSLAREGVARLVA